MTTTHIPRKAICVPGAPAVDISELTPIVDHPRFQKLRGRRQLGINYLVFPGAVHSRFEHTVGVLGLTQRLVQMHGISRQLARELEVFALLHDVGHGPFSHQIEPVLEDHHHAVGLRLLDEMGSAIKACGGTVHGQRQFLEGKRSEAAYIADRNLGMDKLDYLYRDALHIGLSGMPDIENVMRYSHLLNGQWKIEEKYVEDVKRIQKFYSYLHQHGYLGKTALSIQRLFQRAVQERLAEDPETAEILWFMDDAELMVWLQGGGGMPIGLLDRLQNRSFHRTVGVVKPSRYGFVERRGSADVVVREWGKAQLERFCEMYSDCRRLSELEDEAAEFLGLDRGEVLFAAMPYFERLIPRDVTVFSTRCDEEYSLFGNDQDHYRSLVGDYLRTFAIRLVVVPEKRESVTGRVGEFFRELAKRCG
jgi:HD superfamily phosphohydrolase